MDPEKKTRLEAAGYRFKTVPDGLGLSDEQRQLAELRARVVVEVRRRREASGLSQSAVAKRLGSSQSRLAKLEAGSADVSLDLMFRALFALGGAVGDRVRSPTVASGGMATDEAAKGTAGARAWGKSSGRAKAKF